MIKDFGSFHSLPAAAVQPDSSLQYKILFDCRRTGEEKNASNPGLSHLARLINLFEDGGITADTMELAAVVHGTSARVALSTDSYRKRFGSANPDTALTSQLAGSGVGLYVCGQSVIGNGFQMEEIDSHFRVATSALTVLANFQLQGYALMSY